MYRWALRACEIEIESSDINRLARGKFIAALLRKFLRLSSIICHESLASVFLFPERLEVGNGVPTKTTDRIISNHS